MASLYEEKRPYGAPFFFNAVIGRLGAIDGIPNCLLYYKNQLSEKTCNDYYKQSWKSIGFSAPGLSRSPLRPSYHCLRSSFDG